MPGQAIHYVGGTKHFECRVKGHPRPTIRWFKDEVEITDSPRYNFGQSNDGVISMVIEGIAHEDEGHYRCRAENSEGLASTSAYLFVRAHKEHPEEAETKIHSMKIEQARVFSEEEKKERKASLVRQNSGPHFETPIEDTQINGKQRRLSEEEEEIAKKAFENVINEEKSMTDLRVIEKDSSTANGDDNGDKSKMIIDDDTDVRGSLLMRQTKRLFSEDSESEKKVEKSSETTQVTSKTTKTTKVATEVNGSQFEVTEISSLEEFSASTTEETSKGKEKNEADDSKTSKPEIDLLDKTSVKLEAGSTLRIQAKIKGYPKPTIVWAKDDTVVNVDEKRVFVTWQAEVVTFEIRGVTVQDSGTYSLEALNTVGESDCSIKVVVADTPKSRPVPGTPKFMMEPKDIEVEENEKMKLTCCVEGRPAPEIKWFKDGAPIKANRRVKVYESLGAQYLTIDEFEQEDAGLYTCHAENSKGSAECEVKVSMQGQRKKAGEEESDLKTSKGVAGDEKPSQPKPVIEVLNENLVKLTEGKDLKIQAKIQGDKKPTIAWKRDGDVIKVDNRRISFIWEADVLTLLIKGVTAEDSGKYSLEADGEPSSPVEVKVKAGEKSKAGSEDASGAQNQSKSGAESDLVAKADVDTQSSAKDGTDGNKLSADVDVDAKKVKKDDSVKDKKAEEDKTPQSKPKIEFANDKLTVAEGEDLKIRVKVQGHPKPTIDWTKDGSAVTVDDKRIALTWEADTLTLVIKKVTAKDSGKYSLQAFNVSGESESTVDVKIDMKEEEKNKGIPGSPVFTLEPQSIEAVEFEKLQLSCRVDGSPAPKITWFKDGEQIRSNRRIRLNESIGTHYLTISEFEQEDIGTYVCQAQNSKGSSQVEVKVTMQGHKKKAEENSVKDKASPAKPVIEVLNEDLLKLTEGKDLKIQAKLKTSDKKPTIVWKKDDAVIKVDNRRISFIWEADVLTLLIKGVTAEESGKYSLEADGEPSSSVEVKVEAGEKSKVGSADADVSNEEKQSKSGAESDLVAKAEVDTDSSAKDATDGGKLSADVDVDAKKAKKDESIKDKKGEEDKTPQSNPKIEFVNDKLNVAEGEDLKICVKVQGHPKPTIDWTKDGSAVTVDDKRIALTWEADTLTLVIKKVTAKDSGKYSLQAFNVSGESESTVDVKIDKKEEEKNKGIPGAPVFTLEPQSVEAVEFEQLKLSCRVDGSPAPKITWFKDGEQIRSNRRIRLNESIGTHYLTISEFEQDDIGTYVCQAENSKGSSQIEVKVTMEGFSIESKENVEEDLLMKTEVSTDDSAAASVDKDTGSFGIDVGVDSKAAAANEEETSKDAGKGKDGAALQQQEVKGVETKLSSFEENALKLGHPICVAVADYTPTKDTSAITNIPPLSLSEGQMVEVLDRQRPDEWFVLAQVSENQVEEGWVPSAYLTEKGVEATPGARNTFKETFREEVLQVKNKTQEAALKRSPELKAPDSKYLEYILKELVETEQEYVQDLGKLVDAIDRNVISAKSPPTGKLKAKCSAVFSNVDEIHTFHEKQFLEDVRQCVANPKDIGETFMKREAEFQQYRQFLGTRETASNLLKTEEIVTICKEIGEKSFNDTEAVFNLLEKPVDRLNMYDVLLKDVLQYTVRTGEDGSQIESAIIMLKEIQTAVVREKVMAKVVGYFGNDISKLGKLIRHDDFIVYEGEVTTSSAGLDRHLFLFTDKIVVTEKKMPADPSGSPTYDIKSIIELGTVSIDESTAGDVHCLGLLTAQKGKQSSVKEHLTLKAGTDIVKKVWDKDLGELLHALATMPDKTDEESAEEITPIASPTQTNAPKDLAGEAEDQVDSGAGDTEKKGDKEANIKDGRSVSEVEGGDSLQTQVPSEDDSGKPFFKGELQKVACTEGASAKLECTFGGSPTPEVKWYKEDKLLTSGDGVKVILKGDQSVLEFESTKGSDSGTYTVTLSSDSGSVSATVDLCVSEGEGKQQKEQSEISAAGDFVDAAEKTKDSKEPGPQEIVEEEIQASARATDEKGVEKEDNTEKLAEDERKRIEEEKLKAEEKKRIEEEEKSREEEEKAKQQKEAEEKKQKEEEEKRKQEEEQIEKERKAEEERKKKEAEEQQKKEEEERLEKEKKAEEERKKKEVEEQLKKEEEERLEKEKIAEEERKKKEAEEQTKKEEEERLKKEKEAEEERKRKEEEEQRKREEEERLEQEKKAEEERKKKEAEEQQKKEEEERLEKERKAEEERKKKEERLEKERKAEEERKNKEEEELRKREEEERLEKEKKAEAERKKKEEEENRLAEELKAEEERKKEAERKAEEEKRKKEEKKAEEKRQKEEEERLEKERKAEDEKRKKEEEVKRLEEERKAEEKKQAEEKKKQEEETRKAEEEKKRKEEEKKRLEEEKRAEEEKKKEIEKKEKEEKRKQEEKEKLEKEKQAAEEKKKKEEEAKRLAEEKKAKEDEEERKRKAAEEEKLKEKEKQAKLATEEKEAEEKARQEKSKETKQEEDDSKVKDVKDTEKVAESEQANEAITQEADSNKKKEKVPSAPQVIDSMDDVVIELGDLARFDCRVSAYPDPEITWFKDGNKVTPSIKYELLNFHDDIFSLLIKKVDDDDSGRYTCVAKNEFGEAKSEALLNVVGLRKKITDAHVAPEFLTKFYDLEAVEGVPVEFVCVIDGNPEPQVTWLLNGKEVECGPDVLTRRQEDSVMLAFRSVQAKHEGEIICKLKNDSGETICKARLKVVEDVTKRGDKPVFLERPSDQEVNEGGEVTFECVISGLPDPEVTWYFNGRELYESRRRTMKRKAGQKYVLTIRDCIPENAGVYTCKARNRAGDESCAVELSVKEAPSERDLKRRSVASAEVDMAKYSFPPSFTRRVQDTRVIPGRMARFEAMILGVPEPEVEWQKDGFPLSRGPKYTIGMEGHYAVLVVENCDTIDEGNYTCNLFNDAGKASCSAQLRVRAEERSQHSLPRFISPAMGVDGFFSRASSVTPTTSRVSVPRMSLPPEDKTPTMPIEKPVVLDQQSSSCKLSWMPAPTAYLPQSAQNISYIVEARELPGRSWVRLAGGIESTTYNVIGLKPDKDYNFRVKSENRYGTSEPTLPCTYLAREEPKGRDIYRESETPSRPVLPRSRPYVSDIGKESIRLGWKPAELPLPRAGRAISQPPPVSYRVEAQRLPSEEWVPLASRVKKPSFYLSDLDSDRDYNIRVRAQTPYGVSQPTESVWIPRAKAFTGVPVSRPTIVEIEEGTARLQWSRVDIPAFGRVDEPLLYMVEMQEPPSYRWRELGRRIPNNYFIVRDLEPATDYRFRVRAETKDGLLSEPSPATSIFRTLALTHAPVDRLEVEDYDEDLRSARLSWRRVEIPPYSGKDDDLLYMIEYEQPNQEGWRPLVSGIPDTRYRVPDISPSDDYRFRVRALSPYGVSPPSYPTGLYRNLSPMRPLAQDLHLTDLKPDSLRLSWRSASVPPATSTITPPSYQIEALEYPNREWRPLASNIRDTSYQLSGLKPSSDYSFRIRAQTPSGLAEPTAPVTLTSMPVRPRLTSREPVISDLGSDSVRLTWKPAELPYYSRQTTPITYTIDYQEIPSREWIVAGRSIPDVSYTIRGLNPQREYRFRVTPETEFGSGEPSLPVLARRHIAPVLPRREPTLTNITPTSATLSWLPASFPPGASPAPSRAISYRVEVREPPSSLWTPVGGSKGMTDTSTDLQFLHPDQDYMFRVIAVYGDFESEPSMGAYLPHRAGPPKLPHDAPQVSGVQPDSLFLSWRSVELPSRITDYSPVTYKIEVQEGPYGHWSPLARQVNQTHFHVTGLRPDVSYNFRVRAENAFGISDPTDSVHVAKRAVAPSLSEHEPLISDIRGDSLRLTWKPAELPSYLADTVPVTYTILMQEPGDHSWSPIARRVSGTSYYVTGLSPDRDYSFRVQAENNYGTSLPSFPSRLMREIKGPIYSPEIEDIEPSSFRLSWRSPSVSRPTTYAIESLDSSTWKWRPLVSRLPHPSYKVTDISPSRDYAFRVRAEIDSVITEPSMPISYSKRRVPSRAMSVPPRSQYPAPPMVPVERPTLSEIYEDSVRVNWHPIIYRGVTLPEAYRLEVRELPDSYWHTLIPRTDAWSYEVTSLRPDQDYAFRVRTVSDTGMSEPSLPVYLYRKSVTPQVPLPSPEVSDVGDDYINLRWKTVDVPAFEADEKPLSFMIEAQRVPEYDWQPVARGVTGLSHKIKGLEPKRDYQFRLRGETPLGLTQPSTPVPAYRTPLRSGVPITNFNIDRDNNQPYSARLRWNPVYVAPYNPTTGTTYSIEVQEPPRSDWYTLARDVASTSYTVPELSPRKDYMFRIRARSIDGNMSAPTMPVPYYRAPESTWSTLPKLPPPSYDFGGINRPYIEELILKVPPRMSIEKPEMTILTPETVQLSWKAARVPPATANLSPITYRVEVRHEDSFEWVERATNVTGLSTEIRGLNPHMDYAFRVRAVNNFGWSESTLPVFLHRPLDLKDVAVEMEFEELELMGSIFGDTSPPKMPMDTPRMGIVNNDGTMRLSWTAARIPVYARKTPISYSVEKKEPLDQDWVQLSSDLSDTFYTVTGIQPQQDYLFRVKAHNEYGASEATLPAALTRSKTPRFIRSSASRERELEISSGMKRPSYSYIDSITEGVPPRVPQGRPAMSNITETSLTLSWQPGRMPSYIKGPVKITYIVECREPPNHLWRKLDENVGGTTYKVTNLSGDQDYMFRVRAYNDAGMSEPTLPVTLTRERVPEVEPRTMRRRSSVERFASVERRVSRERSMSMDRRRSMSMDRSSMPRRGSLSKDVNEEDMFAGQTPDTTPAPPEFAVTDTSAVQHGIDSRPVKITLQLKGNPLPNAEWYFNGKKLLYGDRHEGYVTPTGLAVLEFSPMSWSDVGEYKCVAENDQGETSFTVQLQMSDPPTFLEPIRDMNLQTMATDSFNCIVDGIPYPTVKFMKDWRPLTETSRQKVIQDGPYWRLEVDQAIPADAGCYICVAENAAGKVFCTARLAVDDDKPKESVYYRKSNLEDDYYVLEELGRGRHSVVRRVIEKHTGKEFVAKFTQVREEADKDFFSLELDALVKQSADNVEKLHDAFETQRQIVLVLGPVKQGNVIDRAVSDTEWSEAKAAQVVKQLVEALQAVHATHVVHLDVKPSSMRFTSDDTSSLRLVDFGFARKLPLSKDLQFNYGTPEFCSPEVINNEAVSPASDIWAVGVIAHVLLTGLSPFYGSSVPESLSKTVACDWNKEDQAFKGLSSDAKDFISKILVTQPESRLSAEACLTHPWLKNIEKLSKKTLDTAKLKATQQRLVKEQKESEMKAVASLRSLTRLKEGLVTPQGLQSMTDEQTGETILPDTEEYGEFLDDESWYDWQSRHQQGPDTELFPLKDAPYTVRVRGYKRASGSVDDEGLPQFVDSDEELDPQDKEKMRTMKERRNMSEIDKEEIPPSLEKELEYLEEKKKRRESKDVDDGSLASKRASITSVSENQLGPYFKEKLHNMAFGVDDTVILRCVVAGPPKPTCVWYKNEELLTEGNRLKVNLEEDGEATLTIRNAKPYDAGVYKCVGRNKHGRVSNKMRLSLGDVPGRPSQPVVGEVSSTEALVIWESPRSDGHSDILFFKVDYKVSGSERWSSGLYTTQESALITGLSPNTHYRFRVSATNRFGTSHYSWSSVEVCTREEGSPSVLAAEFFDLEKVRVSQKEKQPALPTEIDDIIPDEELAIEKSEIKVQRVQPDTVYNLASCLYKGKFYEVREVTLPSDNDKPFVMRSIFSHEAGLHELEMLRSLRHERLACLCAALQEKEGEGPVHLILEHTEGDHVMKHLSRRRKYTEDTVASIIRQVLYALDFLHGQGILHLNLQPASVVVSKLEGCEIKVTDFSLARSAVSPHGEKVPRQGYADFIAPEVIVQDLVSFPTDVWGVGVLAFVLLSGISPFQDSTYESTQVNVALNRYDAAALYETITTEALKFLYKVMKRMPRNRLSIRGCLEHKWLMLTDQIVKEREDTVFLTNSLARFVDHYDKARQAEGFRQDFQDDQLPVQMSKAVPFEQGAEASKAPSKCKGYDAKSKERTNQALEERLEESLKRIDSVAKQGIDSVLRSSETDKTLQTSTAIKTSKASEKIESKDPGPSDTIQGVKSQNLSSSKTTEQFKIPYTAPLETIKEVKSQATALPDATRKIKSEESAQSETTGKVYKKDVTPLKSTEKVKDENTASSEPTEIAKNQNILSSEPKEGVRRLDNAPSEPIEKVKSQDIVPSEPTKDLKSLDIVATEPKKEIKSQAIAPSDGTEEVKSKDISPSEITEEVKSQDISPLAKMEKIKSQIPDPTEPTEEVKSQDISRSQPTGEVKSQDISPSQPTEEARSQDISQSQPTEEVRSQDISPSQPTEEFKSQDICGSQPTEKLKSQDISPSQPTEEVKSQDITKLETIEKVKSQECAPLDPIEKVKSQAISPLETMKDVKSQDPTEPTKSVKSQDFVETLESQDIDTSDTCQKFDSQDTGLSTEASEKTEMQDTSDMAKLVKSQDLATSDTVEKVESSDLGSVDKTERVESQEQGISDTAEQTNSQEFDTPGTTEKVEGQNLGSSDSAEVKGQDSGSSDIAEVEGQNTGSTDITEVKDENRGSTDIAEVKGQDPGSTDVTEVKGQDQISTDIAEGKGQDSGSTDITEVRDQYPGPTEVKDQDLGSSEIIVLPSDIEGDEEGQPIQIVTAVSKVADDVVSEALSSALASASATLSAEKGDKPSESGQQT